MDKTSIAQSKNDKLQIPRGILAKSLEWKTQDNVSWWLSQYFLLEVTTSESSRKVQIRDITLFIDFMKNREGNDLRMRWTPRFSREFLDYLRSELNESGKRRWSDNTISRILAHLKTFTRWIHKWDQFPLGNPLDKIKLISPGIHMEVERALNELERRRVLDAADMLPVTGGISVDRHRYKRYRYYKTERVRPRRKGYRPYRNRAIIYTLVETGMRRIGLVNIDVDGIDAKNLTVSTREKGGLEHTYKISKDGMKAIEDYIRNERENDNNKWQENTLFLSARSQIKKQGRMSPLMVNRIWSQVSKLAGIGNKSPHSCRHGMGLYLMGKTGNPAAVQNQLGHRNAIYSIQYARVTKKEIGKLLEDRN